MILLVVREQGRDRSRKSDLALEKRYRQPGDGTRRLDPAGSRVKLKPISFRILAMIVINRNIEIDERELEWEFIRASGPGGQNVNKVSTAVRLRWNVRDSGALPAEVRDRLIRLAGRRIGDDGILTIHARTARTQESNRREAIERLVELVKRACEKPKPRRRDQADGGVARAPARRQETSRADERHQAGTRSRRRLTLESRFWSTSMRQKNLGWTGTQLCLGIFTFGVLAAGNGAATFALEPTLVGHWVGAIETPVKPLAFDIDFSKAANGSLRGDISIPAQETKDLPLAKLEFHDPDRSASSSPAFLATRLSRGPSMPKHARSAARLPREGRRSPFTSSPEPTRSSLPSKP